MDGGFVENPCEVFHVVSSALVFTARTGKLRVARVKYKTHVRIYARTIITLPPEFANKEIVVMEASVFNNILEALYGFMLKHCREKEVVHTIAHAGRKRKVRTLITHLQEMVRKRERK